MEKSPDILRLRKCLDAAVPLLQKLQEKRETKVLVLISYQPISPYVAYKLNRVLRKTGPVAKLDVVLDSGGGSIDSAYKVLKLLKMYADRVTVIVPFYAKSAASLIAIGADELVMCKNGDLGPVDPQVRDPQSGHFIPAHSIKESVESIEGTKDIAVKLSFADKIPVLLIGAYRESGISSKQYLDHILGDGPSKDKVTKAFTEQFLSHGFPMDRDFLAKTGISVTHPPEETECVLYDLHEKFMDVVFGKVGDRDGDLLMIQTEKTSSVSFGNSDITQLVNDAAASGREGVRDTKPAPGAENAPPGGRGPD